MIMQDRAKRTMFYHDLGKDAKFNHVLDKHSMVPNSLFENWRRQEIFMKRINYTIENSSHVLPWLSCHDLVKRSMYHDLP